MPAPDGATLAVALRWGAGELGRSPTAMLDARVLLKAALGLDDGGLILQEGRVLSPDESSAFEKLIARRSAEEPVAYITGVREFWSLPIAVEPGILVPRADSETLVAAILARRDAKAHSRVLDLGCGSGALLCALLASMPMAAGLGVDANDKAVAITNRNLFALGLAARGRAVVGDWTVGITERFDIVVSNPPYVAEIDRGALPREVEAYEDARALFAGPDGLDAYRRLAALLPAVVAPAALLVVELGAGQALEVARLFAAAFPDAQIGTDKDFSGIDRALIVDLKRAPR